jgi:hypothetical protein
MDLFCGRSADRGTPRPLRPRGVLVE